MSFPVLPLRDALGVPPTKAPIGTEALVSYLIPPVACYITAAMLAVTSRMRCIRTALWPVMALLAFRAAVSVDMSLGEPEKEYLNGELARNMGFISLNALTWTLAKKPLVRHLRPSNSFPSTIMDALDLASNFRGYGWNFSRGLYVPRETRPTNRVAFVFCALLSGIMHALLGGALYQAVHTFTSGVGSRSMGCSIFDGSLPFFARYFRASVISISAVLTTYVTMQLKYDLFIIIGVFLFGQDPAQWPPAFDKPWFATSLGDLWGRRWHQFHRSTFLLGAYLLSLLFGRVGWIIGAFLASAVFHLLMMTSFNNQPEIGRMLVGFGMMGLGVITERAFYKLTGRKVCGVAGWVWTMTWLLLWGNVIIDGFARAGMFSQSLDPDNRLPLAKVVGRLVNDFDAWLHTVQQVG